MVGGVIGFLISIWFYLTADKLKLNPMQWIIGALIIFYGTKALWTFAILKPLMGAAYTHHSALGGIAMEVAGALLGLAACWWFRERVLLKQGPREP